MNWNPVDFIPGHLLAVIILGIIFGVLLITLITLVIVEVRKGGRVSNYVNNLLLKTDFIYELCAKESNQFHDFVKITYKCLDYYITYHFYIPKSDDYLAAAKKEVKRLIRNGTLCDYTLTIISKKEFEEYAC